MKVDFNEMSDEQILEFIENLTDEEFESLDEDARAFLDQYLNEEDNDETEVEGETTDYVVTEEEVVEEVDDEDELEGEEEDELDEETKSAATLHPGKGSGGTESRAHTLETFVRLLQQLGKEDLSHLYNRTIEQIGHEADKIPDSAEKNRSTINAKPSSAVGKGGARAADPMPKLSKEDVDDIFQGQDLTEELKERASTVFEAALNTRIILESEKLAEKYDAAIEELEEQYNVALEEEVGQLAEELTEKLDSYLNYCIEQWMDKNELAIENSLRADIAESFISGLKNLFSEHYVEVPEERLDIVADLKEEVNQLRAELDEVLDRNIELESVVESAVKEASFEAVTEGLTKTQVEKMRSLVEGVTFEDQETYTKKLEIIKENYFTNKTPSSSDDKTGLLNEEIAGTDESIPANVVPAGMEKYVQAISKSVK